MDRQLAPSAYDLRSFETVFLDYVDPLCRYVHAFVGTWEDAENLVQDLFLRLWDRRHELAEVQSINAYLYATARNLAINHLRRTEVEARAKKRYTPPAIEESGPVFPQDAEDDVLQGEIAGLIQRAIDALPRRQREVITLRWRDQLTYDEIAAKLGISPNSVATHLRRAVDALREALPDLR